MSGFTCEKHIIQDVRRVLV